MKTTYLVLKWVTFLITLQIVTFHLIGKNLISHFDLEINRDAVKATDIVEIRDGYYPHFHCHNGDLTKYSSLELDKHDIAKTINIDESKIDLFHCQSTCYAGDIHSRPNTLLSFHAEYGSWREWFDFFRISIFKIQVGNGYNHFKRTKYFWFLFIWIEYDAIDYSDNYLD